MKETLARRQRRFVANEAVKKAWGLRQKSAKKKKQVPAYKLMRKEALVDEFKSLKTRLKNREKALAREKERVEVLKTWFFSF